MSTISPDIDVLAIGETLVDFISTEAVAELSRADTFQRHLGGSPANIAVTVCKLGGQAAIISKTGIGAFGQFLKRRLRHHGVITDYLIMDQRVRTSFVFISRTAGTPEFEPSRNGDYQLTPAEISAEAIGRARVVHASTFALSREPCRSAVIKAFELARSRQKIISFDPNYSPVVWPNYAEAMAVLRTVFQYATLTKASLDDVQRLFGAGQSPQDYVNRLHNLGPRTVILTLGSRGALVSEAGRLVACLPARPLNVVDVTGAGDTFWAGYLAATLDGLSPEQALLFAREIVEPKLTTIGPLPTRINRAEIYSRLPALAADLESHWPA